MKRAVTLPQTKPEPPEPTAARKAIDISGRSMACFEQDFGAAILAFWNRFHPAEPGAREAIEARILRFLDAATDLDLLASFLDMDSGDREDLAPAIDAINRHTGSSSPEEAFVCRILMAYGRGKLSPRAAHQAADEFSESLNDAIATARHLKARHPELLDEG